MKPDTCQVSLASLVFVTACVVILQAIASSGGPLFMMSTGVDVTTASGSHHQTEDLSSDMFIKNPDPVVSPVPGTWESFGVQHPVVMKDNGIYKMWYGGHREPVRYMRIGYAVSLDGINWMRPFQQPIMDIDPTSSWESGEIGYMWVLKEDDEYRMWYSACPSGSLKYSIGYATSTDGVTWSRYSGNPVITPSYTSVYSPVVLNQSDVYYMWYTDTTPTKYISLATSDNGVDWTKKGRVLCPGPGGSPDQYIMSARHVEYVDGQFEMWYTAAASDNRYTTYLATSHDGITWERHHDVVLVESGADGAFDEWTADVFVMHDDEDLKVWYMGFSDDPVRFSIGYGYFDLNEPPTADAGPDRTVMVGEVVDLDGSGSSDADGTIESYEWDFGDGTPHGTGVSTTHIYSNQGTYTVALTVTDDDGDFDTDTCTITVLNNPPAADAGPDPTIHLGTIISLNGLGSYDVDGSIVSYDWDFGDGTAHGTDAMTIHLYADHGTYTVNLTVIDDDGDTDTDTCTVTVLNNPPTATAGSDQTAYLGTTVVLDGSGSHDIDGSIISYDWDFGDGSTPGTGAITTHDFVDHGAYTITLTVTDDDGDMDTDTCTITVLNNPPIADIGTNQIIYLGTILHLDGSGSYDIDGSIVSYDWDLGDSSTHGTGVITNHLYTDHGTYIVTLTVTDDDGDTDTDTCTVTVLNNPPVADAGSDLILIIGEVGFFDASGSYDIDGSVASYDWDWGDGSTHGSGKSAAHAYSSAGTYTVTLTVIDDDGDTDTDNVVVTVLTPSGAVDVLIDTKESMDLELGIETSLDAKLDAAKQSLANGMNETAVNQMYAFINEVEAQRGNKITEELAVVLVAYAEWIIENI